MIEEEWRPVVGLVGLYEVSNLGRVRNVERTVWRRGGRGSDPDKLYASKCRSKVRTLYQTEDGYQQLKLTERGSILVHTLVLEALVGPCPDGKEACHDDGNPGNNKLSNLRWDSPAGNAADRTRHGRSARGENQGGAKLTAIDVVAIRASGARRCDLARQYGVTPENIGRIRKGETWRHVP